MRRTMKAVEDAPQVTSPETMETSDDPASLKMRNQPATRLSCFCSHRKRRHAGSGPQLLGRSRSALMTPHNQDPSGSQRLICPNAPEHRSNDRGPGCTPRKGRSRLQRLNRVCVRDYYCSVQQVCRAGYPALPHQALHVLDEKVTIGAPQTLLGDRTRIGELNVCS